MPRIERFFANQKVPDWTSGSFGGATGDSPFQTGPKATGGVYSESGGYGRHKFESGGIFTWTNATPGTVQYLIVAGGGGGGTGLTGGGGGAGGFYQSPTAIPVSATDGPGSNGRIPVVIGGGGRGGGGSTNSPFANGEGSGKESTFAMANPGNYSYIDFGPSHPQGKKIIGGGGNRT